MTRIAVIFTFLAACSPGSRVPVAGTLTALLAEEDTDGDRKITVRDRGDRRFVLADQRIEGTYRLSVLLQELALAKDAGKASLVLDPKVLDENVVDRTSRLIREVYWDGLTRTVTVDGIAQLVTDEKTNSRRLYVPASDEATWKLFEAARDRLAADNIELVRLPAKITAEYVRNLDGRHGALTLAPGIPFVVPGGRFNEMYGWDSYFIALGLLEDGRIDLARGMVDNFLYQIAHYGKILNANRTYYLTRSQPPFLPAMALAVYQRLPAGEDRRAWLGRVYDAARTEYTTVWTAKHRLDARTGLSRYYDEGHGPCPEVEPGHYDEVLKRGYGDKELAEFFVHDRAVRESGHDTTYRFDERTADFLSVDLNSLLYRYEIDLATIARELGKSDAAEWQRKADVRKQRMSELLWDDGKQMFLDYDVKNRRRHDYVSATALYPLWAGWATPEQARATVKAVLPELERLGGLASTGLRSRGPLGPTRPERQWDYPFGWAPHQMLAWEGLRRYDMDDIASRLAYRWLWMIAKNAHDFNGTVPEKFDVEKASHEVFAEYGNVGTRFSYITREGFGWMNASFQVGKRYLSLAALADLRALKPPAR